MTPDFRLSHKVSLFTDFHFCVPWIAKSEKADLFGMDFRGRVRSEVSRTASASHIVPSLQLEAGERQRGRPSAFSVGRPTFAPAGGPL